VHPHVNAPAAKRNAFIFEAQPLFHSRMSPELDFAAGADYAMPRDRAVRGPESPRDLPGILGEPSGPSYLAVGRDLASWNFPDWREQIAECKGLASHTAGAASRTSCSTVANFSKLRLKRALRSVAARS